MQLASSETCRSVCISDDVLINSYKAMDPSFQGFEFLDLANVNDAELDHIHNVLYASDRSVKYPELPWEEPNYDVAAAVPPPAASYAVPVSHAVPMYLPSVYVNNVTANVSVHHPYLGYHHAVYESPPPTQGRGRGRAKLNKVQRDGPVPHGYQPATTQYVPHPYNTYYPGHAAAHATGTPLFLPGPVPMYPGPGTMGFSPYHPQPMYAPHDGPGGGYPKQFEPQSPGPHEYATGVGNGGHPHHEQIAYREMKDPAVSYTEKGTTHYRLPDVAVPTTNGFSVPHDPCIQQEDGAGPDVIVSALKSDAQVFMPARRNVSKLSFTADENKPGFHAANEIKPVFETVDQNKAVYEPANECKPVYAAANESAPTFAPSNEIKPQFVPPVEAKPSVQPANEISQQYVPTNEANKSYSQPLEPYYENDNSQTALKNSVAAASVGKPGVVLAKEPPGFVAVNDKPAPKVEAPAVVEAPSPKVEVALEQEVVEVVNELPAAVEPKPEPKPTESGAGKSWASLFRSPAGPKEVETKLVARVEPFQTPTQSAADVLRAQRKSDDPHLYRLGEFLCRHQLDHRAVSLQPRGLTNRGNWCYINSTLQALLACPPFYNLMKSLPLPRASQKSPTPIVDSIVQFVNEFAPLSSVPRANRKERGSRKEDPGALEVPPGPAFEPTYIYKMLNNIRSDTFKVEGRQEDAEEFLSCLLNALNDEMLEVIKLVQDPETTTTTAHDDAAVASADDDDEWRVMGPKNKGALTRRAEFARTPVADIFRGNLRSRVQRAGDQSTDNVQPFFTLQLDIEKAGSVREALELLAGRDQLEGVTCTKTNQEVEAWQQVTLDDLPLVLVLHLKWFDYRVDGCTKIVKSVEFPVELKLDAKLMSSTKKYGAKAKQYKLFAVVYHDGKEASKGHYVTDAFHVGCGGWVRYDDSTVKAVMESQVLHPKSPRVPYLLYYRRSDTIGPQTPAAPSK